MTITRSTLHRSVPIVVLLTVAVACDDGSAVTDTTSRDSGSDALAEAASSRP